MTHEEMVLGWLEDGSRWHCITEAEDLFRHEGPKRISDRIYGLRKRGYLIEDIKAHERERLRQEFLPDRGRDWWRWDPEDPKRRLVHEPKVADDIAEAAAPGQPPSRRAKPAMSGAATTPLKEGLFR